MKRLTVMLAPLVDEWGGMRESGNQYETSIVLAISRVQFENVDERSAAGGRGHSRASVSALHSRTVDSTLQTMSNEAAICGEIGGIQFRPLRRRLGGPK
jgi:hypothetical protein